MKTTLKPFFTLVLLGSMVMSGYTQTSRLVCENPNGTEEYLYYDNNFGFYEYASSTRPKRIRLTTVRRQNIKNVGVVHIVKFPGSNATYKWVFDAFVTCTNPDGTKQEFWPENRFVCKNPSGLIEYLHLKGPASVIYYSNNRQRKKIKLKVVGGSLQMTQKVDVQFPGSNKIYKLHFLMDNGIICKNPDGSKQLFNGEL